MLFSNRSELYPHLIAYLRETEGLDLFKDFHHRWTRIVAASAGVPFLIGLMIAPLPLTLLVTAMCTSMALIMMRHRKAELYTPEIESKLEAHRLFGSMRRMLALQRLHRDLSEATLTLLNEIARTRTETKQLLESPYWRQPTLPATYAQLRDQAITACDQAMYDAVMQFRTIIPVHVESRRPGDYVNEAFETFLKVQRPVNAHSDIGFDSAFKVADKLQQMRNELERMTLQGESEAMFAPSDRPGSMLDVTMSEIKTIRQAEEELRQGL